MQFSEYVLSSQHALLILLCFATWDYSKHEVKELGQGKQLRSPGAAGPHNSTDFKPFPIEINSTEIKPIDFKQLLLSTVFNSNIS